jgi:hypothetical protein
VDQAEQFVRGLQEPAIHVPPRMTEELLEQKDSKNVLIAGSGD